MNAHHVVETGRVPAAGSTDRFKNKSNAKKQSITAQERERMIAAAAYYRAECRGFAPGRELEDWLEAEAEIDRQLNDSRFG